LRDASGDIAKQVFRQVVGDRLERVSLDRLLLQVFLECDGRKTIAEVAGKIDREPASLKDAVAKLIELELIQAVDNDTRRADREFFRLLDASLSKSVGPIAPVLIDEELEALGYRRERFPAELTADLVYALGREIQPEKKRNEFQIEMVRLIRDKGYAG